MPHRNQMFQEDQGNRNHQFGPPLPRYGMEAPVENNHFGFNNQAPPRRMYNPNDLLIQQLLLDNIQKQKGLQI